MRTLGQKTSNLKYKEANMDLYREVVRRGVKKHYEINKDRILANKAKKYLYKTECRRLSAIFDSYE
jgi:hypothetical protein